MFVEKPFRLSTKQNIRRPQILSSIETNLKKTSAFLLFL